MPKIIRTIYYIVTLLIVSACATENCADGDSCGNQSEGPGTGSGAKAGYIVGGNVIGLQGTLELGNKRNETKILVSNGSFEFATEYSQGDNYEIQVVNQPAGQRCTLEKNIGVIAQDNITNVIVLCGPASTTFVIAGNVQGLTGPMLLTTVVGKDLMINSNGQFRFELTGRESDIFPVVISQSPADVSCFLQSGASAISLANSESTSITCTVLTYSLTGSVNNLAVGESMDIQLQISGQPIQAQTVSSATNQFEFTLIPHDSNASIVLANIPVGKTCNLSEGQFSNIVQNITGVAIDCQISVYSLSGGIQGLDTGESITVLLNVSVGGASSQFQQSLSSGGFQFADMLSHGSGYTVQVLDIPINKSCEIFGGNLSTNITGPVEGVSIQCSLLMYSVGGAISNLGGRDTLVLNAMVNGVADVATKRLTQGQSSYRFDQLVPYDGSYAISVARNPTGKECSFVNANAAGLQVVADVNDASVDCIVKQYPVNITAINGLAVGETLDVTLNVGAAMETVTAVSAPVTFNTTVPHGQSLSLSIVPPIASGKTCNASGFDNETVTAAVDVVITCNTTSFLIGGQINGLNGTLTLNNTGVDKDFTTSGVFTFDNRVADGSTYTVSVVNHAPGDQFCSARGRSNTGIVSGADVASVLIDCIPTFIASGNVIGLAANEQLTLQYDIAGATSSTGQVVLRENGATVGLPIPYSFPNDRIGQGDSITVSVLAGSEPVGKICTPVSLNQTNVLADVVLADITCTPIISSIAGSITGLAVGELPVLTISVDSVPVVQPTLTLSNTSYRYDSVVPYGASYEIQVVSPIGKICTPTSITGSNVIQNIDTADITCIRETFDIVGAITGLTTGSIDVNAVTTDSSGVDTIFPPLNVGSALVNYSLAGLVPYGDSYRLTLSNIPVGLSCSIVAGKDIGNNIVANVAGVDINCSPTQYSLSGVVANLSTGTSIEMSYTVTDGTGTTISTTPVTVLAGNPSYSVSISHGQGYSWSIVAQPVGHTCSFVDSTLANNNVVTTDVINIDLDCVIRPAIADVNILDSALLQCVNDEAALNNWLYIDDVTELNCPANTYSVTQLDGIELFTNLLRLYVPGSLSSPGLLSDVLPLVTMIQLVEVDVSYNVVRDNSPFANLANLKYLNLSGNPTLLVSSVAIPSIITDPELRRCVLDADPNLNKEVSEIKVLNCAWDSSSGAAKITSLVGIEKLTHLLTLDLSGNNISDISPLMGLTQLPYHLPARLRALSLADNPVSNIQSLTTLLSLENLNLSGASLNSITSLDKGRSSSVTAAWNSSLILSNDPLLPNTHFYLEVLSGGGAGIVLSTTQSSPSVGDIQLALQDIATVGAELLGLNTLDVDAANGGPLASGIYLLRVASTNANQASEFSVSLNVPLTEAGFISPMKLMSLANTSVSNLSPFASMTRMSYLDLHQDVPRADISSVNALGGLSELTYLNLTNADGEIDNKSPLNNLALLTQDPLTNPVPFLKSPQPAWNITTGALPTDIHGRSPVYIDVVVGEKIQPFFNVDINFASLNPATFSVTLRSPLGKDPITLTNGTLLTGKYSSTGGNSWFASPALEDIGGNWILEFDSIGELQSSLTIGPWSINNCSVNLSC